MKPADEIVSEWFSAMMASYSGETVRFMSGESDRFRNPLGCTIRENLTVLLDEISGEMNRSRIAEAVSSLVRLRAVQGGDSSDSTGFMLLLRPALGRLMQSAEQQLMNERIDEIHELVCAEFLKCRERLSAIRSNERRRAMAVPAAMAQAGL